MPFIPGKQNSTGKMVEKDLYCSSEILTTTSTTGEVPTLQLHYPKGTKVVEIGNGRQFVSRPLDPRLMSETATRGNKLTDIENNEEQPYSQHSQRFNDRQRIHPLMYHADHPLYSEQNRSCAPPQTHSSVGSRYLNYDIQYGVSSSMETNTRHSAAPFHGNTGDSRHPFPQGFRQNYSTYGSYGITASPTKSIPTTSQQQQLGCTLGHPKNSGLAIGTPVNVQEILNSTNRSSMPPTVPTASRFLQQRRHVPNATQALSVSAPLQTFFQRSTNSSSLPPYTAPSQPPNTKSSTRLMKLLEGSTRMKTGLKDGVGRGSPVMVNAGYKADAMTLKTSSRGMSGGGGGIQWLFDAAATAHSPWAVRRAVCCV